MNIEEILQIAADAEASDIFIIAGLPVTLKCKGEQKRLGEDILKPDMISEIVDQIYTVSRRERSNLENKIDDDFSFSISQLGRFRVNVFRQRGSLAAVLRVIRFGLPDPAKIGIPESVLSLAENKKGLVLIAGAAGTGKSTTLACMIDRINRTRSGHIIISTEHVRVISLPWKIRLNTFTATTNPSSRKEKSLSIRRDISNLCAPLCVKARMSFCLARCAIMIQYLQQLPQRKQVFCYSVRFIPAVRRIRLTVFWMYSLLLNSSRSKSSWHRF